MAEQIIVEFIPDLSQLETAVEQLAKDGKLDPKLAAGYAKTTQEVAKASAAIKKSGNDLKGPITNLDQLDRRSRAFVDEFVRGFKEGVELELKKSAKELEAFKAKLEDTGKKGGTATKSLKQELRELTQQIARAKAEGGPIDQAAINRAGELKDAMADANAEIANAGSDTKNLDNLVGSISAAAGAFSAVQGAAALFGDESEELQKSLLKVNGAMALATGLQQVANALQKEGAITLGLITVQQKIQNAQLGIEGALQSKNIVVKGLATVAQKALNAAMAANPIGLIVAALLVAIPLLLRFAENTRAAAAETSRLQAAISSVTSALDAEIEAVTRSGEKVIIGLEKIGAKDSEVANQRISNLRLVIQAEQRAVEEINSALARGNQNEEERQALIGRRTELITRIKDQELEGLRLVNEAEKAVAAERKAREEEQKARAAAALEARRQALSDSIDRIKLEQVAVEEGTEKYLRLQNAIITLQAKYDAMGQSVARSNLIIAQGAKDAQAVAAEANTKGIQDMQDKFGKSVESLVKDVGKVDTAVKQVASNITTNLNVALEETSESFSEWLDENLQKIQALIGGFQSIGQGLSAVQQEQANNTQITIDNNRKEVDSLLESGAITEREAVARQKRLDLEEAKARRKSAIQQKEMAIFNATINTLQGVTQALASLPPPFNFIQAGIIAAFGYAQVRAISKRPIPKFAKGKKDQYSGPGIIGEAGPEIMRTEKGDYLATKPTLVYIGKKDKVFTSRETFNMLPAKIDREVHNNNTTVQIDYDKLGKAVGKHVKGPSINIDKDGIAMWTTDKLARQRYFNNRYSSN